MHNLTHTEGPQALQNCKMASVKCLKVVTKAVTLTKNNVSTKIQQGCCLLERKNSKNLQSRTKNAEQQAIEKN